MLKLFTNLLSRKNLEYLRSNHRQLIRFEGILGNVSVSSEENLKVAYNHRCYTTNGFPDRFAVTQNENSFAYNVLKSLAIVKVDQTEDVVTERVCSDAEFGRYLNKDWGSCDTREIVTGFNDVLKYCNDNTIDVSDVRFDKLVDGLIDKVEKLTKEEIVSLLKFLVNSPSPKGVTAHNYHDMWSALDDICCWRLREWDLRTSLEIADLWFKVGLGRLCDFIFEVLQKYSKKPERLSKEELVYLFFYFNICRKHSLSFSYEHAIEQKIHLMDIDEIGIVAMGFFKTKTKIKSMKTLIAIIDCVISNSNDIHEITLAAIVKVLRMSQKPQTADKILELLQTITPQVERLSNLCCLHIGLVGTGIQMFHDKTLAAITEKMSRDLHNVKTIRLKDIERLLLALTMFDFHPKISKGDIYDLLIKQLYNPKRDFEKKLHPKCLPAALLFLSLRSMYLEDLIDTVLNMEFIRRVYGKSYGDIPRELFMLNMNVEVERPDYKGNKIPVDLCRKCAKLFIDRLPDPNKTNMSSADRLLYDVLDTCSNIVGDSNKIFIGHVLPHFSKGDIILCYDKIDKQFITPPIEQYQVGDIVRPTNLTRYKWFAVVPVPINATIRYSFKPVGIMNKKRTLLKMIGYEPILVPYHEYLTLNEDHKINYVRSEINKLLTR